MTRIGIIGYGYVGQAMGGLFINKPQFEVAVYDPAKGFDRLDNVNKSDLVIICVPTPIHHETGGADLDAVEESIRLCDAPLILIKSTIPPGTIDELTYKYQKRIVFSPEYIGEPSVPVSRKYLDPYDPTHHGFLIIGTAPGYPADPYFDIFRKVLPVDTRFIACDSREAEMAKYMENAYFSAKVTFCNEMYSICQAFGISYENVRNLWLNDPRMEADHTAVFSDNRGFGGKCLPKDLEALFMASQGRGYSAPFLASIMAANEHFRKMNQIK